MHKTFLVQFYVVIITLLLQCVPEQYGINRFFIESNKTITEFKFLKQLFWLNFVRLIIPICVPTPCIAPIEAPVSSSLVSNYQLFALHDQLQKGKTICCWNFTGK